MSVVLAAALVTNGPDPNDVTAGWIGFVVFIGLAVAVLLLWLSFRKQLKKIDFEEEPDEPTEQAEQADRTDSDAPREQHES